MTTLSDHIDGLRDHLFNDKKWDSQIWLHILLVMLLTFIGWRQTSEDDQQI